MLKKICGSFLGLMVLIGSACVTPTHASSAYPVIITHIQAGGSQSAKEELVVLYNTSASDVDVTDWCLTNKSSIAFSCFTSSHNTFRYVLPAYSYGLVASFEYTLSAPTQQNSFLFFAPSNGSGSIVAASDSLALRDDEGSIIDAKSWTSPLPAGKVLSRILLTPNPDIYSILSPEGDWRTATLEVVPLHSLVERDSSIPPETSEPENPEPPKELETPDTPPSELPVVLNEVLANPKGSDTGNEFIELFNPNKEVSVDLSTYSIRIGKNLEKTYTFPVNSVVPPLGYTYFSNGDIPYSLLNSTSILQLYNRDTKVGEAIQYTDPKDDTSWALFEEGWVYTGLPTPGRVNQLPVVEAEENAVATTTQKACAQNQYRSLETNRCRNITTSTGAAELTPCKEGQYRNTETNRCRNSANDNSGSAPCKPGQERNTETNRCRNIVAMSKAGQGVKGITKTAEGVNWYMWIAIIGIVVAIVGYGVWEWRVELRHFAKVMRAKFARSKS